MSEREISMLAVRYYKTGVFIAVAMTGFLTCCAHAPKTPKLDHRSGLNLAPLAERFQVPRCQVTVPLSQDEALKYVEQWYVPTPERRSDWIAMAESARSGDQFRAVTCVRKGQQGGNVFLGLFRDGAMVAEMHFVILD